MADEYKVKKIREGQFKGQWGVYRGSTLVKTYERKTSASADANRRNG